MPGETVPVTLTLTNGPSTDAMDVPVEQQFDSILFFPSCDTTVPCIPDPMLPMTFVAPVSTDCPVAFPWVVTPLSDGVVDFSFLPTPPGLTLPAGMPTASCELVFHVLVDPLIDQATLPLSVA